MKKFCLNDWTIRFDHAQRRAGACYFDKKVLSFSTKFLRNANNDDIIDTVLHEIAHAIVGPGQGHNLIWKKKAIEIGFDQFKQIQIDPDLENLRKSDEFKNWAKTLNI